MVDCVFDSRIIKHPRKIRNCDWCNEIILGYCINGRGVFDGGFSSCYYHPECAEAIKTMRQDDLGCINSYFKRGTTEEI